MPLGWAWFLKDPGAAAAPALAVQAPVAARAAQIGDGTLTFHGQPFVESFPVKHFVLTHGEIEYGQTVLKADRIELYPDGAGVLRPGSGMASGHVQVTDPVGLLSAEDVTFNWIDGTGEAKNAIVTVEGVRIEVDHADVRPGVWRLDGIRTGFARGRPLGYLLAAHATLRPGEGLTAYSVSASLLGTRLGGLHHLDYEESGRFGGDRFPVPTFSGDRGIGVRYRPTYLIDDRTAAAASFVTNQTALPSYGVVLARSFLPPGEAKGLIVPRNDLDMRFDFGYFDSVGVASPTREHELVSRSRDNVSVDTQFNVQGYDRKGDEVFAKPLETTFERSLGLGSGFAFLTDNTVQQIHSLGGSDHLRFLDASTLGLPVVRLAPALTLRTRLDAATYDGGSEGFSWIHSQFGLVYRPNESVRLGVAYVAGKQFGTPLYLADQLYSVNGVDLRGDFKYGPRGISVLLKYDSDRRAWYDREFLFSQAIGPFEAFARFRTFPSQFIIGAQLRVDSVFSELLKRNPHRPQPPPKDID